MPKSHLQLADVFRAGFDRYVDANGPLPPGHYDVAHALLNCHTAVMGGHVFRCNTCGSDRISYNSCRNRHCPSCQALARAKWVEDRTSELLPVPYFHVVFTVPAQLNPFALRNKETFYNILFAAASRCLLELGQDQKRLGAMVGLIAVLHTWGQALMDHPHLHFIVPAGGLDDDRWVPCPKPDFLFPINVMASLFRGKFLDAFKDALNDGSMRLHGALGVYDEEPAKLSGLIDALYDTEWVVYARPPFGGPHAVIKYLGRYTHRIAIANSRIVSLSHTQVSFQWKDYADHNRSKIMTLSIGEFIRRFLLHVLPLGFVRIRYYGFLANRCRAPKLQLCRDQTDPQRACEGDADPDHTPQGKEPQTCPLCHKGKLYWRIDIPRAAGWSTAVHDLAMNRHDPGGGLANAA